MKKAMCWVFFQWAACCSAFAAGGESQASYLQLARRGVTGQSLGVAAGSVDALPSSSELRVMVGAIFPIENSALGFRAAAGFAHYSSRWSTGNVSVSSMPAELGMYWQMTPGVRIGGSLLTNWYQRVEAEKSGAAVRLHPDRSVGVSLYGEYRIAKNTSLLVGYVHDRLRAEGSGLSYRSAVDSVLLAAGYVLR